MAATASAYASTYPYPQRFGLAFILVIYVLLVIIGCVCYTGWAY